MSLRCLGFKCTGQMHPNNHESSNPEFKSNNIQIRFGLLNLIQNNDFCWVTGIIQLEATGRDPPERTEETCVFFPFFLPKIKAKTVNGKLEGKNWEKCFTLVKGS